jgi:hypothetical protein
MLLIGYVGAGGEARQGAAQQPSAPNRAFLFIMNTLPVSTP